MSETPSKPGETGGAEGAAAALAPAPGWGGGANPAGETPWRGLLRGALRMQGSPLCVFDGPIIPGASVWTGSRLWVDALRGAGLLPGERVVLALPPSPAFLMALCACLWEGLTVAVAPPPADEGATQELLRATDARLAIGGIGAHGMGCDAHGEPEAPRGLRTAAAGASRGVRFLLRTSGTSGPARWVALGDGNVLSVLESHRPRLGLDGGSVVLSALPWHHAFGLIIDLLPALLAGATIVREGSAGRDAGSMRAAAARWGVTHACMVPLQAARLAALPDDGEHGSGMAMLAELAGGVVGGAPIGAELAEVLRGTRLRVGYGQTEAAPGVSLGEPGEWPGPGYIGRPMGCETRLGDGGMLEVRGANVCLGTWEAGRLTPLAKDGWLATGDLARRRAGGAEWSAAGESYFLMGRADTCFKLANGRLVRVPDLEHALRQVAGVEEAVVVPAGDDGIGVVLGLRSGAGTPDSQARALQGGVVGPVMAALGALADRVAYVDCAPAATLARTAKGSVDRARLGRMERFALRGGPERRMVEAA